MWLCLASLNVHSSHKELFPFYTSVSRKNAQLVLPKLALKPEGQCNPMINQKPRMKVHEKHSLVNPRKYYHRIPRRARDACTRRTTAHPRKHARKKQNLLKPNTMLEQSGHRSSHSYKALILRLSYSKLTHPASDSNSLIPKHNNLLIQDDHLYTGPVPTARPDASVQQSQVFQILFPSLSKEKAFFHISLPALYRTTLCTNTAVRPQP